MFSITVRPKPADSAKKRVLIIAGPNEAGKTTFATQFLPSEGQCLTSINADLIAVGLQPSQPERAALEDGRIMRRLMDKHMERGEDFALERALSGRRYLRLNEEWRPLRYHVSLSFPRQQTPELAMARVRAWVLQVGHDVPEGVV